MPRYTSQRSGWNMVVLQRCRLQYSLFRPILPSLHRPLGALGSKPPQAVAPCGCGINTAYSAVPPRGAIVSMGLRGVQGGLRGEIEIFPGPPAKRNYKEAYSAFCLFYSLRPLVPLAATSLDREAFGWYYMPRYTSQRSGWNKVALLTAVRNSPCSCPFSVSLHPPLAALNFEPRQGSLLVLHSFKHKTRGRIASPQLHKLSRSPAVRWISHCSSNISLRFSAISPCVSRISPLA